MAGDGLAVEWQAFVVSQASALAVLFSREQTALVSL